MRLGTFGDTRRDFDELVARMLGSETGGSWPSSGYNVPTDVFHADDRLIIRMDLPEVDPGDVEVTVQENVLLINGTRKFPFEPDKVRFVRRETFYGDFTQRVTLGKGLDLDKINARYEAGVLELTIPYAEEVQPKKIAIEIGGDQTALSG